MSPGLAGSGFIVVNICKLYRFPGLIPFGLGHNHWFLFVVVTCFIITLFWIFFYLLQIREHIKVSLIGSYSTFGQMHFFINVATSLVGPMRFHAVYGEGQSYFTYKYSTDIGTIRFSITLPLSEKG